MPAKKRKAAPKKKGAPKQTKGPREKKRRIVAKGVVAGKSTKEIAREARCTERNVQQLAAEPETQFLITQAFRPFRAELESLAGVAVEAVREALCARKDDEADHRNRLAAVERYNELLEMAQGKVEEKKQDTNRLITYEEFLVMYRERRRTIEQQGQGSPVIEGRVG